MRVEDVADVEFKTLTRDIRSARVNFIEDETQAMLRAFEARNISLVASDHATCAALTYTGAAATDQVRPGTSTMRFSMRPSMRAPYNGAEGAVGLYTGDYLIRLSTSQSWSENLKQYTKDYRHTVTLDFLGSRREYGKQALEIFRQKPPPPTPLSSEIDISRVGHAGKLVSTLHTDSSARSILDIRNVSIGVETLCRQM